MTASSAEDELRQDIERTRAQLGDTVEALAHKADVPARQEQGDLDKNKRNYIIN